jgi:DNA polymerase-3 subunit delta'
MDNSSAATSTAPASASAAPAATSSAPASVTAAPAATSTAPAATSTAPASASAASAASVAPAAAAAIRPPFDRLIGQPLVARFFSSAIERQLTTHAYLFVGPVGAGKTEAAWALAKALLCSRWGCGSCDDCIRVSRGTHPDVKLIEPEGASGYVSEQMRELIRDTALAPIRANAKVYIITRADLLHGAPANAFLKTLEEPPARVTFILLARTRDSVLETILSRCQIVAFRFIAEAEALPLLMDESRATLKDARIALATTGGSVHRAREFLGSTARRNARLKVLEIAEHLPWADPLDVLEAARELLVFLKQPLDELKIEQEQRLVESREYLSKGALTALEQRQKRALTSRERENLGEALGALRSWLRDCLLVRIGREDDLVNSDFHYNILKVAQATDETALVRTLAAVDEAERRIHYNVSVQSVIEALLFALRDELGAVDEGSTEGGAD